MLISQTLRLHLKEFHQSDFWNKYFIRKKFLVYVNTLEETPDCSNIKIYMSIYILLTNKRLVIWYVQQIIIWLVHKSFLPVYLFVNLFIVSHSDRWQINIAFNLVDVAACLWCGRGKGDYLFWISTKHHPLEMNKRGCPFRLYLPR